MMEFLCVMVVIGAGLLLYATNESTKKSDWVKDDASEASREYLKKHCAEVTNSKQVVMASSGKSLTDKIKTYFHLIDN